MILTETIYHTARELHRQAAIKIPEDARRSIERMHERETHNLSKYVLVRSWRITNWPLSTNALCVLTRACRVFMSRWVTRRVWKAAWSPWRKSYGVHGGCHRGYSAATEPGASADAQRF